METEDVVAGMKSAVALSVATAVLYCFFPVLQNVYFAAGTAVLGFFLPSFFSIAAVTLRKRKKKTRGIRKEQSANARRRPDTRPRLYLR